MNKKVEFISTGNEIMSGMTIDTNFSWFAAQLSSKGISPDYHTSVGDYEYELIDAYSTAFSRADFIISTGGLGPTEDDLAASTAAKFFSVDLEFNQDVFDSIEEKLNKRGRKVLEIHKKQALFPEGSTLLNNSIGTSPGFKFIYEGVTFYFLPGVPREFKSMVENYVLTELVESVGSSKFHKSKILKTIALGESEVAEKLNGIDLEDSKLSYRIYYPQIHLKIVCSGNSDKEINNKLESLTCQFTEKLGDYIFSTHNEPLEKAVGDLLKTKGLTLATAESCTGGLLSSRLTDIPGSSEYFYRGAVTYSNESKVDMLGVGKDLIENFGAVSSEVVEAMASGVRISSDTDIGIAISGIAGPDGGTEAKPVGTVYIGLDYRGKIKFSKRFNFSGNREEIKLISVEYALDAIRKLVLNDV